ICSGSRSITSSTESAKAPITVDSPSSNISTTTMQVLTVFTVFDISKHNRRSTTGTTLPRRLMTPLMKSGVRGILVIVVKSSTSRTLETSMANTSSASLNVRYCRVSVISVTLMISFLSHPEIAARARAGARAAAPLEAFEFLVNPVAGLSHLESDSGFAGLPRAGVGGAVGDCRLKVSQRSGDLAARGPHRRGLSCVSGAEESESADELVALASQFFRSGCHLFGRGSILLNDFLKLLQRFVDLLASGVLFLAGRGDFLHELRGLLNVGHQFIEHLSGLLGYFHGRAREMVDLAGCLLAALGKLAHLSGHHGESLAVLPGARRLDSGIEGQQVGLARDLLDYGDLAGDLLHRRHRLQHALAALLRILGRFGGDLVGLLRVVGVLLDVGNHLLHGGGGFFEIGRASC